MVKPGMPYLDIVRDAKEKVKQHDTTLFAVHQQLLPDLPIASEPPYGNLSGKNETQESTTVC